MQLLNENHIDEMCKIMENYHRYVPSLSYDKKLELPSGEEVTLNDSVLWETLFGGDQLTVARARSAIAIRANHSSAIERLKGLVPVIEDWHTRLTLMKVLIILGF